jgi:hypothetical protein
VLAFRIFVMLSCLIIVPMAAIFGSAFPDVVKSVLVDRIVYWATGKAPEPRSSDNRGGFGTVAPAEPVAPAGASAGDAPPWNGPGGTTSSVTVPPNAPSGGVMAAGATMADSTAGNRQAIHSVPTMTSADGRGAVDSMHSQESFAAGGGGAPQAPGAAAGVADPAASPPDPFTAMERKLREYGATYYLLETWGADGELFRFHCKMSVGNNPNATRHFEATDRDALRAMGQVLERVESWRAGRLQ